MRYLTESFIVGALKRGLAVEQFLGPWGSAERPGVRYVEVRSVRSRSTTSYDVYLHVLEDVGHETFVDLVEFPPFDPDAEAEEFGRLLGSAEDPLVALNAAERHTGAERGRWVNQGVVQDEYRDFVQAGRPSDVATDGRPWPKVPGG